MVPRAAHPQAWPGDLLHLEQEARWRLVEALRAELTATRAAHADALDRLERQQDLHGQQIARLEQLLADLVHAEPARGGCGCGLRGGCGERLQAQAECYETGRG